MALGGTSVLGCVIDRLHGCRLVDEIVVATSLLEGDDPVVQEARRLAVRAARGSAHDVLARYRTAAHESGADIIVRITADCPLIDAALVDAMIESFLRSPCDYLSNTMVRTYPRGLDAEIFRIAALERACAQAFEPYQREHVTPFFYQNPEIFELKNYADPSGADRSQMRWTLDTPEDYAFFQAVYKMFPTTPPRGITTEDVLSLLDRDPSISQLNAEVRQKTLHE